MVKANGTEVKTTSVPLAFRTKHLVFFGDFFSRIVKTALAKRTTTTKAMIPPTKRLGPASPNLPKNRPGIK